MFRWEALVANECDYGGRRVVWFFGDFIELVRQRESRIIIIRPAREKRGILEQAWGRVNKSSLSPLPLNVLWFASLEGVVFSEIAFSRSVFLKKNFYPTDGAAMLINLAIARIEQIKAELPGIKILFMGPDGDVIEDINLRYIDYELNRSHGA